MRGRLLGSIAMLVGALGFVSVPRAQDIDSSYFKSQAQAEAYLRQNPNGPLAKAAFLAIVEFQLARELPGFSRADIAAGVNMPQTRATRTVPRPPAPSRNVVPVIY